MGEDEIIEMQKREALVKGMFRDDNIGYAPIIIKAAQAGALETLVMEAEKIIGNQFKV